MILSKIKLCCSRILKIMMTNPMMRSATAINFAVGQIQQMLKHVLEDVNLSVHNKLDVESRSNIEECFDVNPFQGLDTEYLQAKFYQEHFNLVVSITSCVTKKNSMLYTHYRTLSQ